MKYNIVLVEDPFKYRVGKAIFCQPCFLGDTDLVKKARKLNQFEIVTKLRKSHIWRRRKKWQNIGKLGKFGKL